jgi:hypothetical protein
MKRKITPKGPGIRGMSANISPHQRSPVPKGLPKKSGDGGKQMKNAHPLRVLFLAVALVLATAALSEATGIGSAVTERTLYRFCPQAPCIDGQIPFSGLIMDGAGNLCGTTTWRRRLRGRHHFQVRAYQHWVDRDSPLQFLLSQSACADGELPVAGLIELDPENETVG